MSNPTTIESALARLEAAEKAATPGPWWKPHLSTAADEKQCHCGYVLTEHLMGAVCEVFQSKTRAIEEGDNPPPEEARANGTLISLLRNAAPSLLAGMRVLGGVLQVVEDAWTDCDCPSPTERHEENCHKEVVMAKVAAGRAALATLAAVGGDGSGCAHQEGLDGRCALCGMEAR